MDLTKDQFKAEVLESPVPVLVDFWAAWCGPCRLQAAAVQELHNEADDRYKIGKVDTDAEEALAEEYKVNALPTLIVFKGGKEVSRLVGLQSKDRLLKALTQ